MSDPGPQRIPVRRGFSVSYKGKTLLSMIDPVAQGERLVQGLSKIERTLYLCPSPLYGYGLETLLGAMGPGSAALCVEADEQLLDLSLQAMRELLEKNSSTLRLIRSGDPALICGYIQKVWGRRRFRRLEVIRLSGGWRLFPGFYESLAETIRQDFATDWGNAMTLMKL
ncbi:MAG: hypothetical protein LBD29_09975, partial [Treponema sp.]|nr:hypothetical protein [Treponema sp.]